MATADPRVEATVSAFRRVFGADPARVGRAPGRVNLIGEHTDHNGGLCLPFALPHATFAAVRPRGDSLLRMHTTHGDAAAEWDLRSDDRCGGWAGYLVGTVVALGRSRGYDILVHSDVPVGAGLSSSAALTCAVAVAVSPGADRATLLRAAISAENDHVGTPTGGLDQTVALHARAGTALLLDFSRAASERVVGTVPSAVPGHEWWVFDTRVAHDLADGGYAARRRDCARAARALDVASLSAASPTAVAELGRHDAEGAARARHVITENDRVRRFVDTLTRREVALLGPLLTASHTSLRDDFAVSCAELDLAVDTLVEAGAAGARMVGGGFGGSALALLPSGRAAQAGSALARAFAERGWREPTAIRAGAGAPGAGLVG